MRDYFIQSIRKLPDKSKTALQVGNETVSYQDILDLNTAFYDFCKREMIESDNYIGCQFKHNNYHLPIALTLISNVCYNVLSQDNQSNYLDYFLTDDSTHPWIEKYKEQGIGIILFYPTRNCFELILHPINKVLPRNKNWVTCSQSSGTTSNPKVIVYTSENYVKKMSRKSDLYDLNEHTKLVNCVPFDKITTLGEFNRLILKGGTLYAHNGFNISFLTKLFKDETITHFAGSVAQLIQINHELKRFKQRINPIIFIVGGSDFDRNDYNELVKRLNCTLINHYGSKEVGTIAYDSGNGLKPVIEIKILNNEIWVKTESLMDQYLNGIEVEIHDNWFNTKDTGYLDDKGYLHLTGRISEWINLNGEKFSPIHMENMIKQLLNKKVIITDLIINDKQQIVCIKENDTILTLKEIRKALKYRFEAYHLPKLLFQVNQFTMSEEGKLDRKTIKENRTLLRQVEDERIELQSNDKTTLKLIKLMQSVLPNIQFALEDCFIEIGGDSLKAAELNALIVDEFNISLDPKYFLSNLTLDNMIEEIKKKDINSCIVQLNSVESKKAPLFFIHDLSLDVMVYHNIANLILDREVFGVKLDLEHFKNQTFTIENLADYYLEKIKSCTQGPIYLAGLSIGGLIAYEMACQEERVTYCLMMDTKRINKQRNRGFFDYLKLGLKNGLYSLKELSIKDRMYKIKHKVGPYIKHLFKTTFIKPRNKKELIYSTVNENFKSAIKQYDCKPYTKRIDYFVALDENDPLSYAFYNKLIPNLHRFEAQCLHSSFVKGSQINQSVEWINQRLDELENEVRHE